MSAHATPKDDRPLNERLQEYIGIYLASDKKGDELEVRFGTKPTNPNVYF